MTRRPINFITDTFEEIQNKRRASEFLDEARASLKAGKDPSDFILQQEARGQRELVNSDVLPWQGTKGEDGKVFEAMGIKFDDGGTDELFRTVILPTGWKKRRTDHSMWSELVDDKNRVRAAIFYKAAFYDRSAHVSAKRRFTATYCKVDPKGDYKSPARARVVDADGTVIWESTDVFTSEMDTVTEVKEPSGYTYNDHVHHTDLAQRAACTWLVDNGYPDHNNVLAYW